MAWLIEKTEDRKIIEHTIFSERDVNNIVDNIIDIDKIICLYPHASLFAMLFISKFYGNNNLDTIYVYDEDYITEIYFALKEAYTNNAIGERKISLPILSFFDAANCEKNNAYLRFDILVS